MVAEQKTALSGGFLFAQWMVLLFIEAVLSFSTVI